MSRKRYLILVLSCLALIFTATAFAQQTPPSAYNPAIVTGAVRTWTARMPVATVTGLVSTSNTSAQVNQVTSYMDGWGRTIQVVGKQTSPLGNDQVTPHIYDAAGREQYQYLPFVSNAATAGDVTNDGNLKMDPFQEQVAFYNGYLSAQPGETSTGPAGANWAYGQTVYENSPQNRVLQTWFPGSNWIGSQGSGSQHYKSIQEVLNTPADTVKIWNVSTTVGTPPSAVGIYSAGQLYKTIAINEQGKQSISYKDKYGHVVLKKSQNTAAADNGSGSGHPGWLCTYYVYDDLGHLRFMIPPVVVSLIDGSWSINQTIADELCFRYEYDALGRLTIKKGPGTPGSGLGEVWMVYDVRNRLVMVQDGVMRAKSTWLCRLYDNEDREIMTGSITSSNNQSTMQTLVTGQTGSNSSGTLSTGGNAPSGISIGPAANLLINNTPLPSGVAFTPFTASFYDNYNWVASSGTTLTTTLDQTYTSNATYFITSYNSSPYYAVPITQSSMIRGQVTGLMEQLADSAGHYQYSASYYDDHGRVIQTQTTNLSGGKDIVTNQYNWTGNVLRSLIVENKSGTNAQQQLLGTAYNYDAGQRVTSVSKTLSSTVGGSTVSATPMTISTNQYDELGRLQKKTLGNNLETRNYEYNPDGWLLGVNRSYAKTSSSTTNYFGFDLGYDKGNIANGGGSSIGSYASPVFTGNVAGMVWKTRGDNQVRKYDYAYDACSRLTGADFNQLDGTQFDKTAGIDFSVRSLSYDPNGNLQSMSQNGWLLGGSQQIDSLIYNYISGNYYSNRLLNVQDKSGYNSSFSNSNLGDFHYAGSKVVTAIDYTYDNNGNVLSDANRNISSIAYNYMNLPKLITFAGNKGSIQYVYNCAGEKLQKITKQTNDTVTYNGTAYPTSVTATTNYIRGFVYKTLVYSNASLASLQYTDQLQYVGQDEGRIRALYANASTPATITSFVYDYYLRDQLGNVRMVVTDESQQDIYPAATIEANTIATEETYYAITNDTAHVVPITKLSWWSAAANSSYQDNNGISNPGDPTPTANNAQVYKLNGKTGDRYGLGITLKVMAGDVVSIFGRSAWHNTAVTPNSYPLSGVVTNFLTSFAGTSAVLAGGHNAITGAGLNAADGSTLSNMFNTSPTQPSGTTAPKAGINWILFNDQFQPVYMGTDLVATNVAGDSVKIHSKTNIPPMIANGYLYVYCSNESDIDVFFDNLQVVNTRGAILEETHYYPVGLAMAGISDHAWNKQANFARYQGMELQDQEFTDGTGLQEHDFGARFYDHQIGRWHVPDAAGQFPSPYLAMGNNWPNGTDPNGQWFLIDDLIAAVVGGAINVWNNRDNLHGFWSGLAYFGAGAIGADVGLNTFGAAGFATGAALNTLVDGFVTHSGNFGKMDFKDYATDIINGGTAALSGSDVGADLESADNADADMTGRFGTSTYSSSSGFMKTLNNIDMFLNGNAAQSGGYASNWSGFFGGIGKFVSSNIDQGFRNMLNFYANTSEGSLHNLSTGDYLGAFGIGMFSNWLGNNLFNSNADKVMNGSNYVGANISNIFYRNFVQNGTSNLLNNLHSAIDQGGDFNFYLMSVLGEIGEPGIDYQGNTDLGAFVQDFPIIIGAYW